MGIVIDLYRNEDTIVSSAFESVVFNLSAQKERNGYKSYVFCGSEPEVGTTSIVVEVAIALSVSGKKTLLLDGNLRKGNAYKRLNDLIDKGLADYVKGEANLEEIVYETNWKSLEYAPCGQLSGMKSLQLLYSPNISKAIEYFSEKYDFIIIDGPSLSTSLDSIFLATKANAVILTAALDGSKKKYLDNARKQLNNSGANLVGVIVNKVNEKEYKQYVKDYDYFDKGDFLKKEKRVIRSQKKEKTNG